MFRGCARGVLAACVAVAASTTSAPAQVGEPLGTFNIQVKQGATTIVNDNVTIGPGGDLVDLKATFQDGDPEDYTQVGMIGPQNSPIILKVTTDNDPAFRITHWYLDVPVSLQDIYSPGPTSLFDPNGGDIQVTITGLGFDNGVAAIPLVVGNTTYLTSFLRDFQGHFYESIGANPYNFSGFGVFDIQVPGIKYLDGTPSQYQFTVLATGTSTSWTWSNILNPGLGTTIHNGFAGGLAPVIPGYVFELGLSVAFIEVPEPGTLALLAPGLAGLILRRRRS